MSLTSAPHGKTTTWFDNGQIRQIAEFRNGIQHGYWQEWYENGGKKEDGQYINGNKVGVWKRWDTSGRLIEDSIVHEADLNLRMLSTHSADHSFTFTPIWLHPYFKPLILFTIGYILLAAILFYLFEFGVNTEIANLGDSLKWATSTIPLLGQIHFKPISNGGLIVAGFAHLCGFFAFCFWLALLGWTFFSKHYEKMSPR